MMHLTRARLSVTYFNKL